MQIETYMNMPCEFIAVHEHSRFKTPQFELSQEFADKLYLNIKHLSAQFLDSKPLRNVL